MEFWGVEIKPGSPLKVEAEDGYVIHASQISLGETKKGVTENVPIFVKVGHQEKLLIGTLSQKFPQVSLDLFFEQEFELSHNWKNGSIFVLGYKTPDMDGQDATDEEIDSDCESDEEGLPMKFLSSISGPNGLSLTKDEIEKLKALSKDTEADDAESDDDEEESDTDEGLDESDDDEEETPKKVEPPSKKRSNVEAVKSIAASKKAKTAAPLKSSGGKKNGKSKCPFPCGPSCKN